MQGWLRKKQQREGINEADRYNPSFCLFNIPRRTVWRGLLSQKIKFPKVNQGEATTARFPGWCGQQKKGQINFRRPGLCKGGHRKIDPKPPGRNQREDLRSKLFPEDLPKEASG